MAFAKTYDPTVPVNHSTFESQPGAVRDTRVLFQERLAFGGMYFPSSHDELAGEHSYVRMANQGAAPAAVAGKWMLYVTAAGLFLRAPDGSSLQLTNTTGILSSTPAGGILAYAGASAPSGFLLCNGAAVSRTTYADLFAAIGTTFGVGNGATTFNVPDLRGRFQLGKAAAGTGATLGETGGMIDATHAIPGLSIPSLSVTGAAAAPTVGSPGGEASGYEYATNGAPAVTGSTGTGTTGTGATGPNNPPYVALNYIIKT